MASDGSALRNIVTGVGLLLVAVLTAALAVPPFIDWSAQRNLIEARLSAALGAQVTIAGPLDVRLLPAPSIRASRVRVRAPGIALDAQRLNAEIAVAPLFQGNVRIVESTLDSARLELTRADFAPAVNAARVGIERLTLRDTVLIFAAGDGAKDFGPFDAVLSADSLAGPLKGEGFLHNDLAPIPFRFAAGEPSGGTASVRATLDAHDNAPQFDFDGKMSITSGVVSFAGRAIVLQKNAMGAMPPWRAAMNLRSDFVLTQSDAFEMRLGTEDHALNARGTMSLDDKRRTIELTSPIADLDRFRSGIEGVDMASFSRVTDALMQSIGPRALSFEWNADAAVLGGETISGTSLSWQQEAGRMGRARLSSNLPGGTKLRYDGDALLNGTFTLDVQDSSRFATWGSALVPPLAGFAPFTGTRALNLSGTVATTPSGFTIAPLHAGFAQMQFDGSATWANARASSRAGLKLDLKSQSLDTDALPELSNLRDLGSTIDLDVSVDARTANVSGPLLQRVATGALKARVLQSKDKTAIDLAVSDLAGAALKLTGENARNEAAYTLSVDAQKLAPLMPVVRPLMAPFLAEALNARASALSPAKLDLSLKSNDAGLMRLNGTGTLGPSRISIDYSPDASNREKINATLNVESADSAQLLQQFGLDLLPLRALGPGRIGAKGSGTIGAMLNVDAQVDVAGVSARFSGMASVAGEASGTISLSSRDIAPLLQASLLLPADDLNALPVVLGGTLRWNSKSFEISNLIGQAYTVPVTGSLARASNAEWIGSLSLDRLKLSSVAAFLLGTPQPATANETWPKLGFAPVASELPKAHFALGVKNLGLSDGIDASNANAQIDLEPGRIGFNIARMELGQGIASGSGALRRAGPIASLDARLNWNDVALRNSAAATRSSGTLDLSGAGTSAALLVASLNGQGRARLRETQIEQDNPATLSAIESAALQEPFDVSPARIGKLTQDVLARTPQRIDGLENDLRLVSGVLMFAPQTITNSTETVRVGAQFDLRTLNLAWDESRTLRSDVGLPLSLLISWSGPAHAPARSVDTSALVSALTTRALETETKRNEAIEADIRERAFFNRRLKSERRQDELRKEEARREEARRRAELERQKALEKEKLERATQDLITPPAIIAPRSSAPAGTVQAPPRLGDPSNLGRY